MSRILYPTDEVAQQLSVGLTTAKALIKSGELRSVRIGRARRVPADALQEYVQRLDAEQNGAPANGPVTEGFRHLGLDQHSDGAEVAASTPSENAASIH